MQPERRCHIGVDVGGTFTDMVIARPEAPLLVIKVPSTPSDPAKGVLKALEKAAAVLATDIGTLLDTVALFVHGTTAATNTILERKGARVGLVATEGLRDSLEIRRGIRPDPWDHRTPFPDVLVPRYLRQTVAGRLDRHGGEVEPLARSDIARAGELFVREGVESVAICLHNSYLDGVHEEAAAEALRDSWDGDWITVSSRLAPTIGEFERSSTAVLNAYVAPRTVGYLDRLGKQLTELGLATPVLLIQNNGGAISIGQIKDQPATLLLSGPAAGIGALKHYADACGIDNLISMEIGGTSCDVILMNEGRSPSTDHLMIDGYHLALPSIDVHTVGAGGGTIAGVDGAGMLFLGPQGAGARPGPACYGLGGEEPTVTDAQLLLGRLAPGPYAGGALTIDDERAEQSIANRLAAPLGITTQEAAIGVIRLMEQTLLHAVQKISVERGYDPAGFTLVAGGGAGPLHGTSVARLLGCRQVYVPRLSGAFCALGMLNTDVRHEYMRVYFADLETVQMESIEAILERLKADAEMMLREEGFDDPDMTFRAGCDLRYRGQQWDVQVMADSGDLDLANLRAGFEERHQRLFGHIQPDGLIEMTKLRLVAVGLVSSPPASQSERPGSRSGPDHIRPVWIDNVRGWMDTPIFDGANLGSGDRIAGPALINESTTTVLVGAGDHLTVDTSGNYMIRLGEDGGP